MKIHTKRIYIGVSVVFAVSALLYVFLPDTTFFQAISAVPMVGSLLGALSVLVRDYASHQRAQQLQEAKNYFLLGASSHMANVAFDKHVEFAEKYSEEAYETLITLFTEGPTEKAIRHADSLYSIQKAYRVWLTTEIEERLDAFDSALRKIGLLASYEKRASGNGTTLSETKINEMYHVFAEIVGLEEWEGGPITKDNAVGTLLRWLRSILGTEELTELRGAIVRKAAQQAKE